jgi:hypothetical protein
MTDEVEANIVLVKRDGVWKFQIDFDGKVTLESDQSWPTQEEAHTASKEWCAQNGTRTMAAN